MNTDIRIQCLEDVGHIPYECSAMAIKRNKVLGDYFLSHDQLSIMEIKDVLYQIKWQNFLSNTRNRLGLQVSIYRTQCLVVWCILGDI